MQLPQPMHPGSMNTAPSGPRWMTFGGQSAMQCGCSQWRQLVGTCRCAKVLPASRSRRDRPSRSEEHTSELQSLMLTSYADSYLTNKTAMAVDHDDFWNGESRELSETPNQETVRAR